MSIPNEKPMPDPVQGEPMDTMEAEHDAPSTAGTSTKQLHVNLERMPIPISVVPKLVRPEPQGVLAKPLEIQPASSDPDSKGKAISSAPSQSLISTLASQPQPHVLIPKLSLQAQQQYQTQASNVSDISEQVITHTHSLLEPSTSKQAQVPRTESPSLSESNIPNPETSSSSQSAPSSYHLQHQSSPIPTHMHSQLSSPSHAPASSPSTIEYPKPVTPIVRIKGLTSGQPVLVESPPMEGTSTSPLGSKKRRGERGPDKNPNIDPRTGKRRYIKRKNKRFGAGYDLMDFDFVKKEKKKRNLNKYIFGNSDSTIPRARMRGLKKKHRYQDQDRHNRHHRHSSHKYSSEQYITPWSREEESEAESESSQDVSERLEVMDSVWRPTDDLRLIMNMLQTNDLREVQLGTKFSSYYSLEELESRWDYLLFDDSMGKVSQTAIRNLPGRLKYDICSKALFSARENALLQEIGSASDPKHLFPVMKKLLNENPLVFLKWRVPQDLIRQWMHLRDFHLLSDQDVRQYFAQRNFEDFERTVNDHDLYPSPFIDEAVQQEKLIQKRINRKKIRRLEREIQHWQAITEKSNLLIQPIFKTDAYAMLRGRAVSYFMTHKEITFGRRTDSDEDKKIDADLTLEGSVYKISRRQGIISLREDGQFVILNQGKHTIYVDGKPLFPQTVGALRDRSVIEVSLLSFVFLFNHELLKKEAERMRREKIQRMESVIFGSIPRSMFSSPSLYLPPHISSHLASSLSSSVLTSSMSNTLPPLIGNRKFLGPNNSPFTPSDKMNLGIPNLNQMKPGGLVSPQGNMLNSNMLSRPNWYLESSRLEPPPLTSVSRISSPMLNTLQLSNFQSELLDSASPLLRSLSLPYSSYATSAHSLYASQSLTSLAKPIPMFATRTTAYTSLTSSTTSLTSVTSPIVTPSTQIQGSEPVTATVPTSSIQFGDLTIRPGIPPHSPSESPSLNS